MILTTAVILALGLILYQNKIINRQRHSMKSLRYKIVLVARGEARFVEHENDIYIQMKKKT